MFTHAQTRPEIKIFFPDLSAASVERCHLTCRNIIKTFTKPFSFPVDYKISSAQFLLLSRQFLLVTMDTHAHTNTKLLQATAASEEKP